LVTSQNRMFTNMPSIKLGSHFKKVGGFLPHMVLLALVGNWRSSPEKDPRIPEAVPANPKYSRTRPSDCFGRCLFRSRCNTTGDSD
jgi:hypothetical protein